MQSELPTTFDMQIFVNVLNDIQSIMLIVIRIFCLYLPTLRTRNQEMSNHSNSKLSKRVQRKESGINEDC